MNMQQIMRQAQKMQKKMEEAQEEAAKEIAAAQGKTSSLTLAADDNYLNYENAEQDEYIPGEGITGRLESDPNEGSLTMGEEEEEQAPELSDFEFKIRKLKIMLEHDLITEEEFKEMKKNLISSL